MAGLGRIAERPVGRRDQAADGAGDRRLIVATDQLDLGAGVQAAQRRLQMRCHLAPDVELPHQLAVAPQRAQLERWPPDPPAIDTAPLARVQRADQLERRLRVGRLVGGHGQLKPDTLGGDERLIRDLAAGGDDGGREAHREQHAAQQRRHDQEQLEREGNLNCHGDLLHVQVGGMKTHAARVQRPWAPSCGRGGRTDSGSIGSPPAAQPAEDRRRCRDAGGRRW